MRVGIISMLRQCVLFLIICPVFIQAVAQCPNGKDSWDKILGIENDAVTPIGQKLEQLYTLQKEYRTCGQARDSVYARLLHRIGTYEYTVNKNIATISGIQYTQEAVQINTSGNKGSCRVFAANSYVNLGYYYASLLQNPRALAYFDTAIQYSRKYGGKTDFILKARLNKCLILIQSGDYQKSIEECTVGLAEAREESADAMILGFFNQRALSGFYQGQSTQAMSDADSAAGYASSLANKFELATALKTKALVNGELNNLNLAGPLFAEAIRLRLETADYSQVADDYTDLGNYFLYHAASYRNAKESYAKTLEYARRANDSERIAKAYTSMGVISFYQRRYPEALHYYSMALDFLLRVGHLTATGSPDFAVLEPVANKDLVLAILANKIDVSIQLFKGAGDRKYLKMALQTALLADSVLSAVRHEQVSEQS